MALDGLMLIQMWSLMRDKCAVIFKINTFWLEKKAERVLVLAAFQGHTHCFSAATGMSFSKYLRGTTLCLKKTNHTE